MSLSCPVSSLCHIRSSACLRLHCDSLAGRDEYCPTYISRATSLNIIFTRLSGGLQQISRCENVSPDMPGLRMHSRQKQEGQHGGRLGGPCTRRNEWVCHSPGISRAANSRPDAGMGRCSAIQSRHHQSEGTRTHPNILSSIQKTASEGIPPSEEV